MYILRNLFYPVRIAMLCMLMWLISLPVQAGDKFTIGLATWSGYPSSVQGFKDALAEKGLQEGQQLTFIEGQLGADKSLQTQVARQFRDANVDLVYSLTTPGTTIVKEVLPDSTPIVFSIVTYPADSGLIESFEYSGNNLVGTSNYVSLRHYLTLLQLLQPDVKRVAVFHRKGEPNSQIQSANIRRLFKRQGIETIEMAPENILEVTRMARSVTGQVDAFMTTTDTLMQSGGEAALIEVSLEHKIPILSSNKAGIEQGASFGPVADFYTLGYMSGMKAAEILTNNTEPTRLESELQNPPLFLVNRKSINALGISISPEAQQTITWVNEDS